MKFAISTVDYFNSLGFDTSHWRKSVDGTKALVHAEMALIAAHPDELELYDHNDESFLELLRSAEWTKEEYEVLDEPAQ